VWPYYDSCAKLVEIKKMKTCPQCGSQYTDDTLQYCLQDGTPLASSPEGSQPTVVLGETETLARTPVTIEVPPSHERDIGATQLAAAPRRGSGVWVVAAVSVFVLLLGAAALATAVYLLYPRDPSSANIQTTNNVNLSDLAVSNGSPLRPTPTAVNTVRATPGSSPTVTNGESRVETDQAHNDALRTVYAWRSALQSRDLEGYMSNYADTVNYYKRAGVSVGSVRADKARAFQLFNSMKVDISNESASVSPDEANATVTFDKEWHFSGRSTSDGKTRSQLEFRKINGRWLITGERDLQLYYKR
jgi:ketosteroid isomerase-like protein